MMLIPKTGLWLAAAMLVAGCGRGQTVDASSGAPRQAPPATELIARARPPIPDLPVPIGFKIDEGKSRDYVLAGARFVDHFYKGNDDKLAVKRFYERQMPINRWMLVTAMFVRGEVMLDFEKETERCRVFITNGSLFHKTYVKIQLWTSGPIQTPTSDTQK